MRPRHPIAERPTSDVVETVAEVASTEAVSTAAIAEYETRLEDFIQRSKKARSTIGASISASIMVYIEGMTDSAQM